MMPPVSFVCRRLPVGVLCGRLFLATAAAWLGAGAVAEEPPVPPSLRMVPAPSGSYIVKVIIHPATLPAPDTSIEK